MAQFRFCLIGSPQSPVLELPADSMTHLHARLAGAKFVEGRMVSIDGTVTSCDVLIPVGRILMVLLEDQISSE